MTRHEGPHPHQSDTLTFLPKDYTPHTKDNEGRKTYGVITFEKENWDVRYQSELPAFGGYLTKDSVYGNPTYCPNATRLHRQHLREYGSMPHLVYFDSEGTAQRAGFRRCKKCMKHR